MIKCLQKIKVGDSIVYSNNYDQMPVEKRRVVKLISDAYTMSGKTFKKFYYTDGGIDSSSGIIYALDSGRITGLKIIKAN